MSEPDRSDEALGRRLAAELPRYAAPPGLRARLREATTPPPRPGRWLAPALASLATALVVGLALVPLLPRSPAPDPLFRLVRAVAAEHTRAQLWGVRRSEVVVPTAVPWLRQESGIELQRVFLGDERLSLVASEPVYLDRRRGLAVHYQDAEGRHVSYIVLPAPELKVPERARIRVDRFRPALLRDDGLAAWVWRQGGLACFVVSELDVAGDLGRFQDYFLRIRTGTEPLPAS